MNLQIETPIEKARRLLANDEILVAPSDWRVLVHKLLGEIEALKKPGVVLMPCKRHEGMTFTLKVGYSAPMRQVCPGCEPQALHA